MSGSNLNLNQRWPISMSPYGVTGPQCVNISLPDKYGDIKFDDNASVCSWEKTSDCTKKNWYCSQMPYWWKISTGSHNGFCTVQKKPIQYCSQMPYWWKVSTGSDNGLCMATSHYLNQWWLSSLNHIYLTMGGMQFLSELKFLLDSSQIMFNFSLNPMKSYLEVTNSIPSHVPVSYRRFSFR